MDRPKVSVVMITYNHEKYIEKAINGVFIQKTNFPVELIISNDCSPDNSDEVIKKIISKAPENITVKYTKHEKNLGMIPNFVWSLKQATGKYIALCEGDDYWTEEDKLQTQFNFLENNPNFIAHVHNVNVINGSITTPFSSESSRIIATKELYNHRKFHTASIFFLNRDEIFKNFPTNIFSGDRLLFLLLSIFGKIYYMDNIFAVYRTDSYGASKIANYDLLKLDINMISYLKTKGFGKDLVLLKQFYHQNLLFSKNISKFNLIKNYSKYIYFSIFAKNFNYVNNIKIIKLIIKK